MTVSPVDILAFPWVWLPRGISSTGRGPGGPCTDLAIRGSGLELWLLVCVYGELLSLSMPQFSHLKNEDWDKTSFGVLISLDCNGLLSLWGSHHWPLFRAKSVAEDPLDAVILSQQGDTVTRGQGKECSSGKGSKRRNVSQNSDCPGEIMSAESLPQPAEVEPLEKQQVSMWEDLGLRPSSFTCDTGKVAMSWSFTDGNDKWLKQNVGDTYNVILFGLKKEGHKISVATSQLYSCKLATDNTQMSDCDCVPVKLYLWTPKLTFQIVFTGYEMCFSQCILQSFLNVKVIFCLKIIQKQAVGQIWSMGQRSREFEVIRNWVQILVVLHI